MSNNINHEIEAIRNNMFIAKFENELKNDTSRQEQLKKVIESLNTTNAAKLIDQNNNKEMTLEDKFKELDKAIYMQPWNKLNAYHKTVKIKEYVALTFKDDIELAKEVCKLLLNALNDKKLNTVKTVDYDGKIGKIKSVPVLKKDDDDNYIIKVEKK